MLVLPCIGYTADASMIPKIEFKAAVKKQKKFKNKKKKKINLNSRNKPQYECTKFPDENIKIPKTDRKPLGVGSESYYVFWNANT